MKAIVGKIIDQVYWFLNLIVTTIAKIINLLFSACFCLIGAIIAYWLISSLVVRPPNIAFDFGYGYDKTSLLVRTIYRKLCD